MTRARLPRTALAATAAATAAALALPLAAPTAPVAHAAPGSSGSSSAGEYRIDPNDPSIDVPERAPLGSAYTGIAPITFALAAGLTFTAVLVLIDATPALRQAVDNLAAQAGLSHLRGSSEGNRIFDVPNGPPLLPVLL